MNHFQFLQGLQLCDSLFPTGAFSFSDGLEYAVQQGVVTTKEELSSWIQTWTAQNFSQCDGRAILQTFYAWQEQDWSSLQQVDAELTALKWSAHTRKSSHSLGKQMLRTCLPLYPQKGLEKVEQHIKSRQLFGNAALVFGIVFAILEIPASTTLLCYGYTKIAGMVSAALRLMQVGQQGGQAVLQEQLHYLSQQMPAVLQSYQEPLQNFTPLVEMAQMNQQYLHTRLFRS